MTDTLEQTVDELLSSDNGLHPVLQEKQDEIDKIQQAKMGAS